MRHSGRVGNENEYNAASVRILAPGTWVRPCFLGVHGIVEKWEEGKTSLQELDKCLGYSHFFLSNGVIYSPTEEKWERCKTSAAVLASPAFQADARTCLIAYSACVANAFPPFGTGNVMTVHARIFDIFAYTAMAEATVLIAQANATAPNWEQLASNTIDLGNAWMGVNASTYTKEAAVAFSKIIAKRLSNMASGLKDLFISCLQGENGLQEDAFYVPIDVSVQLTTAVERLLALAGSCANVYKPPAEGSNFGYVAPPARPALGAAAILSNFCYISVRKFSPRGCERTWKKAMEASLSALETATKTASLLFNSLTREQRDLFLNDDPVVHSGNDFNTSFTQVLHAQMFILTFVGDVAPSEDGKLFVASGFLTFIQASAMLERHVQGSSGLAIEYLSHMVDSDQLGVLLECLLTSDGRGIACLHSVVKADESILSGEKYNKSLTMLENILETDIPKINDKDPARLKLRAQVLGLRGCGHIKCTILRPSSKKSFGKLCAGCQSVRYCGAQCQKADWKGNHKGACKQFQTEAAA